MAQARFKDLTCLVLDVGADAAECAPGWADVTQRVMATRMLEDKPHMELAVITFGADRSNNVLWQGGAAPEYAHIDVVTEFQPCKAAVFEEAPARLTAGSGVADPFSALVVAADLLKRTVTERKLQAARKSIVVASPFLTPFAAVDDSTLEQLLESLQEIKAPVISAGVAAWVPAAGADAAAMRAAATAMFRTLHRFGAFGVVTELASPLELFSVVRTHSCPSPFNNTLKIAGLELAVKTCKLASFDRLPTFKPFCGDPSQPDAAGFVKSDTEWFLKGAETTRREREDRSKAFRFGMEHFPAVEDSAHYKWQPASEEAAFKGLQVLCFVRDTLQFPPGTDGDEAEADDDEALAPDVVPRWALQDTPTAVLPGTTHAATAMSALVHAMRRLKRAALVRYALTSAASIALGVLLAAPATLDNYPDHFLLFKAPWADDFRSLQLPGPDEVVEAFAAQKVAFSEEHLSATAAFIGARTHSPPDAPLPCDLCCDPARNRLALAVVRAGLRNGDSAAADAAPLGRMQDDTLALHVLLPLAELAEPGTLARRTGDALLDMFPALRAVAMPAGAASGGSQPIKLGSQPAAPKAE